MATGQFSGNVSGTSGKGKDPRASVAIRPVPGAPPPASSSGGGLKPTPARPGRGPSKLIFVVIFVVLAVAVGIAMLVAHTQKEAADEQTQKIDTVKADNEVILRVTKLQTSVTEMQQTIAHQDQTIQQLRADLNTAKASMDRLRATFLEIMSNPGARSAPKPEQQK